MSDYSDLEKQLRGHFWVPGSAQDQTAADTIAKLRDQVEKRDAFAKPLCDLLEKQADELATLRADNERLRSLLAKTALAITPSASDQGSTGF